MKYFVLASLLCLSACGDDNDNKNNETPQNLAELTKFGKTRRAA